METRRVTIRKGAAHIPRRFQGTEADVVVEVRMSFGKRWLRLRFEDGSEYWTSPDRVEAVDG